MAIINRFVFLLNEKQRTEKCMVTFEMINSEIGIALSMLSNWTPNYIHQYKAKVIAKFWAFVTFEPDD